MSTTRIGLLSAYRADSHARWADALVDLAPGLRWDRIELPGRHFAWRIRGNPLSWLDELAGWAPDAIIATSMVDLATIRGLHPGLAAVPTLLYFHENQFAWPRSDRQTTSVEAQMVQLYAALCADRVLFNSAFNRSTFQAGVAALMERMPDQVPSGVAERIERKSDVLPVPVVPIEPAAERDPGLIVWNHRWEHDKDPGAFAEAICRLARGGADFRLALLGPRGARSNAALERLRDQLPDRIEVDGCPSRAEYAAVLARAGIVVSTARHEFQGLAVLEAVSAGCRPIVPDALCYREQFDAEHRYPAGDVDALVARLVGALEDEDAPQVPVERWTGPELRAEWSKLLRRLAGDG